MLLLNRMTKRGFTLIELLVVVSLIGILATLVIANMNSARERARDTNRKSDLRNIQTALRLYYNDNSSYPAKAVVDAVWGQSWSPYMNILPTDPLNDSSTGQVYTYTYVDSDNYILSSCLENKSDDKCVTVADTVCASTCQYSVKP